MCLIARSMQPAYVDDLEHSARLMSDGGADFSSIDSVSADPWYQSRDLASRLSHALRTPLTALRAELEEARLHPDQTHVLQLVDRALPSIDRLEAVAVSMLELGLSRARS
ncbi:hypothetical protein OG589_31380 [Sphaerisporangium sp. NBC_01403]|uniref:histidine kinase dimerization/phospho-acceptor domain-containing protein n=1 Tax=Sphaerisporangium sp. NBC_01403 TaxID=2903599 RepID=UPI0032445230